MPYLPSVVVMSGAENKKEKKTKDELDWKKRLNLFQKHVFCLFLIIVRSLRWENYENREKTRKRTKFGTNIIYGITNHFRRGATKKYPRGDGEGIFL